jgi:hypothetical protein
MPTEDEVDPDADTNMPAPRQDESRSADRAQWSVPVTLRTSDAQHEGVIVDVSPQGMQVETSGAFAIDTDVDLELPSKPPVPAKARVVWTRAGKGPNPAAVGLEFTWLDVNGFSVVETLMAELGVPLPAE